MLRLSLLTTMVVLLALPAVASASSQQIFDDCQDNGRLDKKYADSDYRKALKDMPEDLDEYTNCSDLVRAGLSGVDTTGGSNAGGGSGGSGGGSGSGAGSGPTDIPQTNGAGSVPLDPKGKPLNPLIDAQADERKQIGSAQAGEAIRPTSAGVRPGEPEGSLPVPLIVLLVVAGVAGLAAGGLGVRQFFNPSSGPA
jgi:hypothetical protein